MKVISISVALVASIERGNSIVLVVYHPHTPAKLKLSLCRDMRSLFDHALNCALYDHIVVYYIHIRLNPLLHSDWFKEEMNFALCFRSLFSSMRHVSEHAAMLVAEKQVDAAVAAQSATEQHAIRSCGITAETWTLCTRALQDVGCQVLLGNCAASQHAQSASSHLMRKCHCSDGVRMHIREDGCPCHCGHCVRCNLAY
jgi:hypothetical protein